MRISAGLKRIVNSIETNTFFDKSLKVFSYATVIFCFCYAILPMIIFGENYVHTIHDGLDSYAAMVEFVHKNNLYFNMNQELPIMNHIEGKYFFMSYTLYDFLNCIFGFLNAQIITRILGVSIGFFSMFYLLRYVYKPASSIQNSFILLIAIAYTITPCAPNRTLAFATLPLCMLDFLYLKEKQSFTKKSFYTALLPCLSIFDAVFIFVLGFWALFTAILCIKERRINVNLIIAFIIMCFATIIINIDVFRIALAADDTNRGLISNLYTFNFYEQFKGHLLNGQYHADTLHRKILLPFMMVGTIWLVISYIFLRKREMTWFYPSLILLGWFVWVFSSFVIAARMAGISTGILVIDGFNWGRLISFMRILWYLMFASVFFLLPQKKVVQILCIFVITCQLLYIGYTPAVYNDSQATLWSTRDKKRNNYSITFKEFFSSDLFEQIKKDIQYNYDGVVAYGFHPAVLMYNGFNTIDGYLSVHSMKNQTQFREIIAPALEKFPDKKRYYDYWGGRMYLYGELPYRPTREKPEGAVELLIDSAALKKYNGRYIFSRAPLSNAASLGITLVKDYDTPESLYHIYLYEVI